MVQRHPEQAFFDVGKAMSRETLADISIWIEKHERNRVAWTISKLLDICDGVEYFEMPHMKKKCIEALLARLTTSKALKDCLEMIQARGKKMPSIRRVLTYAYQQILVEEGHSLEDDFGHLDTEALKTAHADLRTAMSVLERSEKRDRQP